MCTSGAEAATLLQLHVGGNSKINHPILVARKLFPFADLSCELLLCPLFIFCGRLCVVVTDSARVWCYSLEIVKTIAKAQALSECTASPGPHCTQFLLFASHFYTERCKEGKNRREQQWLHQFQHNVLSWSQKISVRANNRVQGVITLKTHTCFVLQLSGQQVRAARFTVLVPPDVSHAFSASDCVSLLKVVKPSSHNPWCTS